MSKSVSLCIIAKNESDMIANCIKSALPYVDQVVVVDTGSSDKTPEIAKELGAEVWNFNWNNDFSAARNFSLEKARGDWILYMDCDEEVVQNTGDKLLEAVQSTDFDAYFISIRNVLAGNQQLTFNSIRLFRNLPQFRFEGKIHEQISYSIIKYSGSSRIGRTDFTLLHHGYNPELVNINAKIARNVKLLEEQQQAQQTPDGFLLYNMGIEYVRQGKFQQALEKFIESLKISKINCGYAPNLANKIVVCLIELQRYRDALEQLKYFQSIFPDYRDLYSLESVCHMRCGRFSLAVNSLEKAQSISHSDAKYPVEGNVFGRSPEELRNALKELTAASLKSFKITICILAENHEKNIAKCMVSIGELADKIMLVTSGCSDKTLHIAFQMGAEIYRLEENSSFAKLRNFALQQAKGDWILFINGDEELNQSDVQSLISELNKSKLAAYKVRLRSFYQTGLYTDYALCRIIRNDKELAYQSSLLEDIDSSVIEKYGADSIGCLPAAVFKYGQKLSPGLNTAKFKRDLSLIIQDKTIINPLQWHQALGCEFMKADKHKAALAHFNKVVKHHKGKNYPTAWYYAIKLSSNLRKYNDALKLCEKAVKFFPDYTNIFYLRGCCNLIPGNLKEAEQYFKICLEMGEAPWEKYVVHPGAGSYLARCGLAEVYSKQGAIDDSIKNYTISAQYSEGIDFAVPPLTNLIIKYYGADMVLNYMKDKGLTGSRHLCKAAAAVMENGCLMEALALWQEALEKAADLEQYKLISSTMFQILGSAYHEACCNVVNDDALNQLAPFFKEI